MVIDKNLVWRASLLCLGLAFCLPLGAQQQGDRQRAPRDQQAISYGVKESSDLAQDNLNHVAASAAQIRAVLVKDEGLLVELKRWVAKEATDNGQVVDDSNLADQAIFERLEQDVVFRSVATRLLQRYGYLLPTSNPDSDLAKEKELVLKERARRLVQVEAQEDSESLQPKKNQQDLEQTAGCDPRTESEEDCQQQSSEDRRQRYRSPANTPFPGESSRIARPIAAADFATAHSNRRIAPFPRFDRGNQFAVEPLLGVQSVEVRLGFSGEFPSIGSATDG